MGILSKIFDHEIKELKKFEKIAFEIEELDEEMSKLSDLELKAKTDEFKTRLSEGETLDDILVEAFATIREAAYRVLGEKAFHVQIIGGLAIHYGNIAEMKTGEGKTLTSTLPAYLNALEGKGVHIITANEYLSSRDAAWMGQVHEFLGLTVGANRKDLTREEKKAAYACDITYSTNNEIGFDYLRDNMVVRKEDRCQRGLNFAIIDEVVSILIDESRTPLIISGGVNKGADLYVQADRIAKGLKVDDYAIDEKLRKVTLNESGVKKIEKDLHLNNLYDLENSSLVHHIDKALTANYAFKKDVDYVVDNDQIIIVDTFTGRLMHGRQFSEGLHQALEAKEGVTINSETKTLATITFQNLFRMYNKLSGMTGTAKTEEEEFTNIYNMFVLEIPTNKPIIREDLPDLIYPSLKGKYNAIANAIEEIHKTGQPILVGTASIESSEIISGYLKKKKIKHELLNAKNHEREATIIEKAGEKNSVTIATNMAGRGTDIKLGKGVVELGGLYVIGTERHDSRRIDNQLRGRSGRQGDPGLSQFFVSFEDDLMRRFGTDRVKNMLLSLGIPEDQAIQSKMFTKSIETAQKKVEGNNYDNRKSLLDYDNVMNSQREIIYRRRNEILDSEDINKRTLETFEDNIDILCDNHIAPEGYLTPKDRSEIIEYVNTNLLKKNKINITEIESLKDKEVSKYISDKVITEYQEKVKDVPTQVMNEFEKAISLRVIDNEWVEHISTMEHLREGIGLRGYGQSNPLQAYTQEGFELFEKLQDSIDEKISIFLLNAQISHNVERKQTIKGETNDGKEKVKSTPKKVTKVGRNDPCPCGSGKKYKNCCGK